MRLILILELQIIFVKLQKKLFFFVKLQTTQKMGVTFVKILNEVDMAQVFLWLQVGDLNARKNNKAFN